MTTKYETYDVLMLVAQKFNGAVYTDNVEIEANTNKRLNKSGKLTEVISEV